MRWLKCDRIDKRFPRRKKDASESCQGTSFKTFFLAKCDSTYLQILRKDRHFLVLNHFEKRLSFFSKKLKVE